MRLSNLRAEYKMLLLQLGLMPILDIVKKTL